MFDHVNELFAFIGRFLLNSIKGASVNLFSGGVVFEYSIDEKNRPKSLALRRRVEALSSAEIQKVLDRPTQTEERMTLVDFVEMN